MNPLLLEFLTAAATELGHGFGKWAWDHAKAWLEAIPEPIDIE